MNKKIIPPQAVVIQDETSIFIGYENKLSLFSASKHKLIWTKILFEQTIQEHIEKDVQLDFIKAMEMLGDKLFITTRKGKDFTVEI